jgi:hypothetical protein
MIPAHWLNIKPIKLGKTNTYLYFTILTKLHPESKLLGLSSQNYPKLNNVPSFNHPGFTSKDSINVNLMTNL